MFQDIFPHTYHNEYIQASPDPESRVVVFDRNHVWMHLDPDKRQAEFPMFRELKNLKAEYRYLFAIDKTRFFLALREDDSPISAGDLKSTSVRDLYRYEPSYVRFAAITALQLKNWYENNRYCGRCGEKMSPDDHERMLKCDCGNIVYPKITPAIIAAVRNGSKILLTKYADREYKRYALIAGFSEVGETIEDTVRREVMEEVGLKVRDLRFYKSQPWPFSDSLLMGFFCDLDGSDEIRLDVNELSEARWVDREDLDIEFDGVSLTNEMIIRFKENDL
ncbi:MAG: NAD(+) diphosphatase [Firmicutes bacterium]|nr:NAD(+) diphosphatase [Bacillota bacterium]